MIRLLRAEAAMLRNRVAALSFIDEFKGALFLLMGTVFLCGVYLGAWRLLSYLHDVPMIGSLLIQKLMAMVFLTSFAMMIFSSLIASLTTIFASRDLPFLMAMPLPHGGIFAVKSAQTILYASGMVILALIPFLLAAGQVMHAPALFYVQAAVHFLPFAVTAGGIGIIISVLLMRFFPVHRTRDIVVLLGILFITGLYLLFRFLEPERLVRPDGLEAVSQYLRYLDTPTGRFLPSWWISKALLASIGPAVGAAMDSVAALWLTAAAVGFAAFRLAERFYFAGWAEAHVYHRRKNARPSSFRRRSPWGALMAKDLAIFFRDTAQWSQMLLLAALVIVYVFSMYKVPFDTVYLQNLIAFFNVGLIGFILAALALRFVYPAVTLEGDYFWILRAAPITSAQLLQQKLVFGALPVAALGGVLVIASNSILKTDAVISLMTVTATIMMAVSLCALAAGFGALFPAFHATSTAQVESSFGGLLYIGASLFYIGLTLALWAVPLQGFYHRKFGLGAGEHIWLWPAAGLVVMNIAATALPLYLGSRALGRIER